jgi:hypothetical protein
VAGGEEKREGTAFKTGLSMIRNQKLLIHHGALGFAILRKASRGKMPAASNSNFQMRIAVVQDV